MYKDKTTIQALQTLEGTLSLEEYYDFLKDRFLGRIQRAHRSMPNSTLRILPEAEHLTFSDWGLVESVFTRDHHQAQHLKIMNQLNELLASFFKQHLQ